jgi:hypothetical protein
VRCARIIEELMGMTEKWFFHREGDTVVMRARFETDDCDTVGDAFREVPPGEEFYGLSYKELFDAEGGLVLIEDDVARIAADDEDESDEDEDDDSDDSDDLEEMEAEMLGGDGGVTP